MFEKRYPLAKTKNDYLDLRWQRGYLDVEVYYRNRLIKTIPSPIQLKKGVTFHDEELGEVQLFFSDKPMTINVIVDGFHSPINSAHPKKELTTMSRVFWVITALSLLGAFVDGIYFSGDPIYVIVTYVNLFLVAIYAVSAYFLSKGKGWAFFLGSVTYILILFLLIGLNILADSLQDLLSFGFILRIMIIVVMSKFYKTALSAMKHAKYEHLESEELLDQ